MMKFVSATKRLLNKAVTAGQSAGEKFTNTIKNVIFTKMKFSILAPVLIPLSLFIVIFLVLSGLFGEKLNLLQMVDPYYSKNLGTVVFDAATLEEYYQLSQAASETGNTPAVDLAGTQFGGVAGFNKHIKDTVCLAGYGTRNGVIAAGLSLIGDYIKYTGKRLRYDQYRVSGGRQWFEGGNNEGIINEDFYLDCSSFAWWALYNGGFNVPNYPYTGIQKSWSDRMGYSRTPGPGVGQGGDYLVRHHSDDDGHIVLILGTYDNGYYCAEESGWGVGGKISKRDYSALDGYVVIDMSSYYANQSNVRDNGKYCEINNITPSSSSDSRIVDGSKVTFTDHGVTITINGSSPGSNLTVSQRETLLKAGLSQVGLPYNHVNEVGIGWDCSGLLGFMYRSAGIMNYPDGEIMDGWSERQLNHIKPVSESQLSPGDVVGWGRNGVCVPGNGCNHIAIWLGENRILHANGSWVTIQDITTWRPYSFAGPII